MFPKGYFTPQYFADVYWEPLSGAPPVIYDLVLMLIETD
jgi:hypothetical protein